MAIYAELHDGTRLEFPDETDPAIIQRTVKKHLGQQSQAAPATFDSTEGMSGTDKVLAGIGKGFVDTGRGVKQLLNIGDQEQLKADIAESRNLDKPLMSTTGGAAGNVIGNIAATAPAMLIPGANTVLGGAAIGAGIGALTPTVDDSEILSNVAGGGIGGGAGVVAGRALPSVLDGIIAPFTEKGREKIVGNVLRDSIGNNFDEAIAKLKNPEVFVQGSTPNAAEVLMNPKIAALVKAVRNLPEGRGAIVDQEINSNAARLAAIRTIAKDDMAIEAAKAARTGTASELYKKAGSQNIMAGDDLASLLNNPSIVSAAKAAGIPESKISPYVMSGKTPLMSVATGKPVSNTVNVDTLHKIKLALDDSASFTPTTAFDKMQQGGIISSKNNLLSYLDDASPDYANARRTYEEMSRPINQMEIGRELKNALTPALTESGLPTRERAAMFADAIRKQQATIKRATGFKNQALEDVMTPEQMGIINGISKDLERKANVSDLAAAKGSDTAQNMIADNMLRSIVGPIGMPNSWGSKIVGSALVNAIPRRAVEAVVPGVERKVQSLIADALTNPQMAAEILSKTNKKNEMARILTSMLPVFSSNAALNAN
jgi:hypothetical protein